MFNYLKDNVVTVSLKIRNHNRGIKIFKKRSKMEIQDFKSTITYMKESLHGFN